MLFTVCACLFFVLCLFVFCLLHPHSTFLQTETVEEPLDEDEEAADEAASEEAEEEDEAAEGEEEEDATVEEDDEEKEDKPKTKKVEKTTWDWVLVNDSKPIWLRRCGWSH